MSFLTRYFLLRPPAQDPHAYDMVRRFVAVYIHFIIDGFIPHGLPTICLHCINAVVALWVIRVICGFQVSLLSRVNPNALLPWIVQVLYHSLTKNPSVDSVRE